MQFSNKYVAGLNLYESYLWIVSFTKDAMNMYIILKSDQIKSVVKSIGNLLISV